MMEEETQNEEEQDVEVDVTEISLGEDDINEWIGKLEELRETKSETTIELDEENELLIKYVSEESEGEDDTER